jgi:uncharacterized protein
MRIVLDKNLAVSNVTPGVIKYVVEKIVNTVHPSKVILFGSQARSDSQSDSDIDLLVITGNGQDREAVRLEIEKTLRGRRFGIDLLVRTPEDLEWNLHTENPFYIDGILRDGQVMYERQR